jgi:hypothetical protein
VEVFSGAIGGGKDGFDARAEFGLIEAACTRLSVWFPIDRVAPRLAVVPIKKLVMDSL